MLTESGLFVNAHAGRVVRVEGLAIPLRGVEDVDDRLLDPDLLLAPTKSDPACRSSTKTGSWMNGGFCVATLSRIGIGELLREPPAVGILEVSTVSKTTFWTMPMLQGLSLRRAPPHPLLRVRVEPGSREFYLKFLHQALEPVSDRPEGVRLLRAVEGYAAVR